MNILLSIACITYKHENFIEQTIQGFLCQKTNFNFEIVICNDASPDNSDLIIKKYSSKNYSNILFKYFKHETNIGVEKNGIFCLRQCIGKYIAFCEGDDYWTDSNKLQKQVDFLEINKDFVLSFHNTKIFENGTYEDDYFIKKNISQISNYDDLLILGNFIQTSSVVLVNKFDLFPFDKVYKITDYVMWFWISQYGKIYRFNENMSVYRIGNGIWSSLDSRKQMIHTLNSLYEVLKIVKDQKDVIVLDNRIKSITFSLLPYELQKINRNDYKLKEYLSRYIDIKILLYSLIYKITNKIFNQQ